MTDMLKVHTYALKNMTSAQVKATDLVGSYPWRQICTETWPASATQLSDASKLY